MIPIAGQPILTAAQMRAAEEQSGIRADELMRRAGRGVATAVARLAGAQDVLVLCGPGNNGGDGYVAATLLAAAGIKVRVASHGDPCSDAARAARSGWAGSIEALDGVGPAPILVDALFGTGLSRPLDAGVAGHLAQLAYGSQLAIAVDLPSGVSADDGAVSVDMPPVAVTLALGAVKPAHLLYPAAGRCGAVRLIDIGLPVDSSDAVLPRVQFTAPRPEDHKYTRGMIAIVAGTMPGAAALAATAAARVAGYVLLLGSATDRLPHAIVRRRWSEEALTEPRIDTVLIGPGLGRDATAQAKLDAALASDHPLVIDGDALHLITPDRLQARSASTILTPHAGEFTAFFGTGQGSKIDRARAAAVASGATIVFKGADTVIAHHDGRTRVTATGVPWLATAGTGDVLAGLVAGLLAHGHVPFTACTDGVALHTEAARRAGPAFIADDLIAALPAAIGSAL